MIKLPARFALGNFTIQEGGEVFYEGEGEHSHLYTLPPGRYYVGEREALYIPAGGQELVPIPDLPSEKGVVYADTFKVSSDGFITSHGWWPDDNYAAGGHENMYYPRGKLPLGEFTVSRPQHLLAEEMPNIKDPLHVLEWAYKLHGLRCEIIGFGYNSISIVVKDQDGNTVVSRNYGS